MVNQDKTLYFHTKTEGGEWFLGRDVPPKNAAAVGILGKTKLYIFDTILFRMGLNPIRTKPRFEVDRLVRDWVRQERGM